MGAIHFSIDTGMIRALQASLNLETFVETGTFEGASVQAARNLFKKIFTIELSADLHRAAVEKFKDDPAVDVLLGNSPEILQNLRPRLEEESVLYWLDAHWCVADAATVGKKSQCPLMQELDAIHTLNEKSVILIDDARLFLSPPLAPHEISDWPDFDSIVRKLFALNSAHVLAVINDVITYVPRSAFPGLRQYAHNHSPDVLVALHKVGYFDQVVEDLRFTKEGCINLEKRCIELGKRLDEEEAIWWHIRIAGKTFLRTRRPVKKN